MADLSHPRRYRLPRSARVKSQQVFRRAFAERCRASDQHIVVFAVPNDTGFARLGISIGKAYGRAVQRNRIKRLIREAFRHVRHELPAGIDLIIVPRKESDEPTVSDLQASICRLSRKLHRRTQ
ncbi:MAG: ribonuclease P protein component [Phycisphaerae bacterium]